MTISPLQTKFAVCLATFFYQNINTVVYVFIHTSSSKRFDEPPNQLIKTGAHTSLHSLQSQGSLKNGSVMVGYIWSWRSQRHYWSQLNLLLLRKHRKWQQEKLSFINSNSRWHVLWYNQVEAPISHDHSKRLKYSKSHEDATTTPPRTTQQHGNNFCTDC